MNSSSSISAFSLYQLAWEREKSACLLDATVLENLVGGLIDALLETDDIATLWLKLTPKENWQREIDRYQVQSQPPGKIYALVGTMEENPLLAGGEIPIVLQESARFQHEVAILARSPQFSILIVAEQPENLDRYRTILSFDPLVGARVLAGIRAEIAPHFSPPETFFADIEQYNPPPPNPAIAHFFGKHLQRVANLDVSSDIVEGKESSQTAKEQFFSQGLQELSSTLTRMKTALSLLQSPSVKTAQRHRYLEMLQQECDRQNSLICGMRSLVEIHDTLEEVNPEPVQLTDVVPAIVSTYQPLAMERGIQLGYTVPAQLPPIVCPSHWLRLIIVNLLNNSLRFTPPNGKVSVQASRQGEYVQLAFKDTGMGIAPQELSKIFDCFYRGRSSAGEANRGAGLGLTSVQQLLLRCGGSISVTSQPNKGSTFKVLLPVVED